MKYIRNHTEPLEGRARHLAIVAKAASVDTEGAHTSVAHFMCGENPWGFHNDLRFTLPAGKVRQGLRIIAAGREALDTGAGQMVLSDEDYEVLLSAASDPRRHPSELPMPPTLARAILPLIEAIESATDEPHTTPA